jgi:hypothetical protein
MRRSDREITDWATIETIIRQGKYTSVALCRNNEPYGVTLSYGYDKLSRSLYFHCAKEGLKTDFVRTNASACATIIEDNGYVQGVCVHKFRSVVIRGKIEFLEEDDDIKRGLGVLLEHLEENPEARQSQLPTTAEGWQKVSVWKMTIDHVSAKEM